MNDHNQLLKNLIENSFTLKSRLSEKEIQTFLAKTFSLSQKKQAEIIFILEEEKMEINKIEEKRKQLAENYYQKIKIVKTTALNFIRKNDEVLNQNEEKKLTDDLLNSLN